MNVAMNNEPPYVQVAAFTHLGQVRLHNEDCLAVGTWLQQEPMKRPEIFVHTLDRPLLCLIADGLGGQAAGEVASHYVAKRLSEEAPNLSSDERALVDCLVKINTELFELTQANPSTQGMGTTVAGLLLTADGIVVFNLGDSRVYRREGERLLQLTMDDTPEAAYYGFNVSMYRSAALTQCLGGLTPDIEIEPHTAPQRLKVGGYYLICSDGLTDMVSHEDLETSLSDDLPASITTLFNKAIAAGGHDNISVLLVRVDSEGAQTL